MKHIFLIFGYGIPKDIQKDENYNFYLKMVFNRIYDLAMKNKAAKPLIIFCGGETDVFPPYARNEAEEMARFFSTLISQRPFLKDATEKWTFAVEKKSLSPLENLLFAKKAIVKRKLERAKISIFCEQTRGRRIGIIAKKVFARGANIQVLPIDFDVSANRYLPESFLAKKEKAELHHSLWALRSPENLKKHHQIFAEKIAYLRQAGPDAHGEALKNWWQEKLRELEK